MWCFVLLQLNLPIDDQFTLKHSGSVDGTVAVTGFRSSLPQGGELAHGEEAEPEADVWGVVVPPGKKGISVTLKDELDESIHITQLAMGPKAKNASACVQLSTGKHKTYLGTLHPDGNPQLEACKNPSSPPLRRARQPRHHCSGTAASPADTVGYA